MSSENASTPHDVTGTVVITGGNGFVGRHLQLELKRAWPHAAIVSWDLPDIDVTNPDTYRDKLAQLQPAWVVHLAAVASVPAALEDPDTTRHVNVEGTQRLFEAIQRASQDTNTLFVSTADIYGAAANQYGQSPIPELSLAQAQPANPYAVSKLEAERIIETQHNNHAIRVRPFPHIGPGQDRGFVTADFASQVVAIEAGTQEPMIQVGNLEAERDFTDVRDVVRAYRLLMERGKLGEVYHVASGKAVRIQAVLGMLLEQSAADIAIQSDETRMRPSDIPVMVGDARKLSAATDWQPRIAITQSLTDILEFWRQQDES